MAEYTAGSASVPITPDFSDFHTRISEELDTLGPQFESAGDKSGKLFADAFSERVKEATAGLDVSVKADADTTELDADLDEATRSRTVPVDVGGSDLDAKIAEVNAKIDALASKKRTAKIDVVEQLQKGGTLGLPEAAGIGALALGPQAVGLGLGVAALGAGFAAAGADAAGFGVIAKGMFTDVTTAQKALTKAQQDYAKATTSDDQAKALQAEADALKNLTPAEKDLLTQLTGLEGAWKKLDQAEQPVVEGALTPWLKTAQDGMRLLDPLITDGANAIQFLGSEADSAIQSPFWDKFSTTLGQTGEDTLTAFGDAVGHVGDGLAHLFVTFAPDIDKVLPLVDKLGGAFDDWAKSVTAGGLENFFKTTFSPANVKALAADGKDVASFVENVAKASADIAPLAFGAVSDLLKVLGSVPPGVLEAGAGLFLAIKTVGSVASGINAVSNVINTFKGLTGLFGGAAAAAEAATEGTEVGTAAGSAAATAFTGTFGTELNLALPTAFVSIGTSIATEADAAGTVWGTAAATTFGTAFAAEDALGVTAALTAVGAEASAEAGIAGAAVGTAFAGGVAESLGGIGAALAAAIPEAGLVAVLAAGVAGAALGTAVGVGFNLGLAATGVSGAAAKIGDDVKSATAQAATWLTPAGQDTVKGYITGFDSQQSAATAAAGQLKGWVQAPNAGSASWLNPSGQQAGQGFNAGFGSMHALVDNAAASLKNWVTSALPAPESWLVNVGISAAQGLANGLVSGAQAIYNEAANIANSVLNTLNSAFNSHSPSRETMKIGGWAGQGLGIGLASMQGFVEDSASTLATTTLGALSGMATAQSLSALGVPRAGAAPRLPGVSSPLRTGQLQLQFTYAGTGNAITDAIVSGLQVHIQGVNGGDVQGALGQGPVRTGPGA